MKPSKPLFSPQPDAPRAPVALAVLLALGMAPAAHATVTNVCNITPGERTSAVFDSVMNPSAGEYVYSYEVCNSSEDQYFPISILRDWELPFDGSGEGQDIFTNVANIRDIVTPEGWDWAIEKRGVENEATGWEGSIEWQDPGDPFFDDKFADHEYVLHFYTDCFEGGGDGQQGSCPAGIDEGGLLGGFGFTADIAPGAAPYQASWFEEPPNTGDPAFPLASGIPNTAFASTVPEPGTLGLFAGGLGAVLAARRRRRRSSGYGT